MKLHCTRVKISTNTGQCTADGNQKSIYQVWLVLVGELGFTGLDRKGKIQMIVLPIRCCGTGFQVRTETVVQVLLR